MMDSARSPSDTDIALAPASMSESSLNDVGGVCVEYVDTIAGRCMDRITHAVPTADRGGCATAL